MHLLLVDPFQPILSEEGIYFRDTKLTGFVSNCSSVKVFMVRTGVFILCPMLEHSYFVHGSVQAISGTVGNISNNLELVYHSSCALHQTRRGNMLFWPDSRSTKGKGDRERALKCCKRNSLRDSSLQAPFPVNV